MAFELAGKFILEVSFGDDVVVIQPENIDTLSIIEDMNSLVPSLHLRIADRDNFLTNIKPFDHNSLLITITLKRPTQATIQKSWIFKVYKSFSEGNSTNKFFDITGLLDVKGLFEPLHTRGWVDTEVKVILLQLAEEMDVITSTFEQALNDSNALDFKITLLQTRMTNAQLLYYMRDHLVGKDGTAPFKCFFYDLKGETTLAFNDIKGLSAPSFRAVFSSLASLGNGEKNNIYAAHTYEIANNYREANRTTGLSFPYSYYDYMTGEYVDVEDNLTEFQRITSHFMFDSLDLPENIHHPYYGREEYTNEFDTKSSASAARLDYYDRMYNTVKMWVTIDGLYANSPGAKVDVTFMDSSLFIDPNAFQYGGPWIAERIVHDIKKKYLCKVLLTREGLQINKKTSLVKDI